MAAWIAHQALIGKVDRREDAVRGLDEIGIRRNPGVEHRDGHASSSRPLRPKLICVHDMRVDR